MLMWIILSLCTKEYNTDPFKMAECYSIGKTTLTVQAYAKMVLLLWCSQPDTTFLKKSTRS